jgi:hypothetical protein
VRERALLGHSFAASYMAQAVAEFAERPFRPFDTVVLVWGGEVRDPGSVSRDRIELYYLGRFAVTPTRPMAVNKTGERHQPERNGSP